jgi:hypothetical protein
MSEGVAAVLGHPRQDPLRGDQDVGKPAERDPQRCTRCRQQDWPMYGMSKCPRKIEVGYRVWRDCIHWPTNVSFRLACSTIPARSLMCIQGIHCRPLASRPPMLPQTRYNSATTAPLSVPAATPSRIIDIHDSKRLRPSFGAALWVITTVAVFVSLFLCLF